MAFYNLTNFNDNVQLASNQTFGQSVRGLDGDDSIGGTELSDDINGNQGDDTIFGFGSLDGSDRDTLRGGKGNDYIQGGLGNDILNGNNENDLVDGDIDNDVVRGGRDSDTIYGNLGNDTLIGDLGTDFLIGNLGQDVFVLRADSGNLANDPSQADLVVDYNDFDDFIGILGAPLLSISLEAISWNLPPNYFSRTIVQGGGATFTYSISGSGTRPSTAVRLGLGGPYLGIIYGIDPSVINRSVDLVDASAIANIG
jgi:Ca2+-binding RTX toxin-like protein